MHFVTRTFSCIVILLALAGCDGSTDYPGYPPNLTGSLWSADAAGRKTLYYVIEEERQNAPSRRRSTSTFTRYELIARDLVTAQLLKKERLRDVRGATTGRGPDILGPAPGALWLWNEGPEARDYQSLKVRFESADLQKNNPELASVLPTDKKFYKVSTPHNALLFKGTDARFYQIDAQTGKISPARTDLLQNVTWMNSVEEGFRYVQPPGRYEVSLIWEGLQIRSFVTPTRLWYSLLSDEERDKVSRWPGGSDAPYGEVARQLYRTPYTPDDQGKPEIQPSAIQKVGKERFLQGGFLKRSRQAVWDVPDPSSSLVLCKDALGENKPWVLARLTRDGKALWRRSTGLFKIEELADGGEWVILYGFTDNREPTRDRPARLVWINTATGKHQEVGVGE